MNLKKIEYEAQLLSLLGQPTRLKLLYMLRNGETCVCKIHPEMEEDQSVISRHLIKMREAGLLSWRKEGVSVFYKIKNNKVYELLDLVDELIIDQLVKKEVETKS